jgi:hypothetical protein
VPLQQCTGRHIYKEAWETLPDEVKAAINAQDFEATALGGPRSFTVAEALVWNAVYGPTVAGHAAQAARPFIPSYAKKLIARVAAQAKCARFAGGSSCTEASVEAFLKHEMFSGGSVPKFEKSKGKKRAPVNHFAATASTAASAVDLVDEDDDHLDKHALNDGHVREAVYASAAFTADQPVEIDATEAEAAAASKAATAAHEAAAKAACTPSEEDDLLKKSSGAADPTGEACFAALPLFEVGDWVRVLPVTAPGSLPRLATGFPEATVVAYDAHTGEYTVRPSVMCSRQQTKIPRNAVVAVSRDGNEELKTRGGLLSSEGAKVGVQAERSTPINLLGLLKYSNMLILNNIAASNFIIGVHLHGKRCTHTVHFLNHYQ